MTAAPATPAPALTGAGLLDRVRAQAAAEAEAARAKMQLVVAWAATHPGPGAEALPLGELYADHEVELAGPGAPGVSQFAVVELAAALGKSAESGRRYVGDALELAHRLPRLWRRVVSGQVEAWRAQSVAQRTKQLSAPAAAWVDAQVADRAPTLGPVQVGRLVERAIVLFDVEKAIERTYAETYVRITPGCGLPEVGLADLAHVEATVPLTDALALEQAVAATAHRLLGDYPDHSLDERRALALGRLADHVVGGDPHRPGNPGDNPGDGAGSAGSAASVVARELSLVVHLDQPTLAAAGLAEVHTATGTQHLVTVEAVAAWCVQPGTKVNIRPVIDLGTPLHTSTYAPSSALREQIKLLSATCAFPHCTIPAERCDIDHIRPWHDGGATSTHNLAPLCRLHHRVKTHGEWTYTQPAPGTYHWTSPTGDHYRRNRDGTTRLHDSPSTPMSRAWRCA